MTAIPTDLVMNGRGTATVAVVTTGSAGSAAGTATIKGMRGVLTRIKGNWGAGHANSDVTIVESDDTGSRTLYTKSDSVADFDIVPKYAATDNAGAALSPAETSYISLSGGTITITIAQSTALDPCLIVTLVSE